MTVTERVISPELALDEDAVLSIDLAVAQWLRSPRATSSARERLRARGVDEREILRRRRCESADRGLADLLRLAVTFLIARGRLEERDLRRMRTAPDAATLRAVAAATARAFYDVSVAESVERAPFVAIDMEIGDY